MASAFRLTRGAQNEEIIDWCTGSVAEGCRYRAAKNPNLEVLTFLGDGQNPTARLTAQMLDKQAGCLSFWLNKLVQPGQRVVLLFENGPDYLIGLFGCLYAGAIPVSGVYPTDFGSRQRFCHIVRDSQAVAVVGCKNVLSLFQKECASENLGISWIPVELSEKGQDYVYAPRENEQEALIQYTSGSTNIPKGVIITNRNIIFNLTQQGEELGYAQGDVGVSWLPLSHDMGLMGSVLMAIGAGGQCILLPPEKFLEKPLNWLHAISTYKATLSGGPGFAYEMCLNALTGPVTDLDLSCWDQAFIGSEAISKDMLDRFTEKFSPYGFRDSAFCPCYGLAEATLLVSSKPRGTERIAYPFSREALLLGEVEVTDNPADARELVSCGQVIADTDVVIMKNEASLSPASEMEEGLIYIHGPGMAAGYCGYGSEVSSHFVYQEKNYFATGDKGFFVGEELFLTGRKNNEIILNGFAIDPEDLVFSVSKKTPYVSQHNATVFLHGNIDPVPVFVCGLPHDVLVYADDVFQDIQEILYDKFRIEKGYVYFVSPSALNRTPSGKIIIKDTKIFLLENPKAILRKMEILPRSAHGFRVIKQEKY
ncbi:hypothetical protein ACI01nite_17160 [Acetobacter cibinongensis]|uniref:Fatty-acid--CoA ligase/beta-ketoacyl synthase n=2 Tax=Acetobacter cibinongensis TaxID=146475 RepID=A0A0D6N045_9PROT|nr:AMP-binding protein [Acetobacter cibinongensis]GAN59367.1 fatty-acid--CoA ligase/beta-ketoacyl synthase [Acetobacter cibinongensis]GBQ13573.1 acyl-CoA synthetase [Acetobacter cibinongensis NRIC 0482]GEL59114.1 hypothetical protein ACI01nite_17160 [Acetobacter cibinongensis]